MAARDPLKPVTFQLNVTLTGEEICGSPTVLENQIQGAVLKLRQAVLDERLIMTKALAHKAGNN